MLSTHLQDLDSDFHNATSTGPPICAEGMQQKGMCYTFWILWAVGGRALQMPPEAGMPMGKASLGDVSTARSVMLEVHYDNPGKEQIIDQSGFRLYYTDQLRANDAVILTLGHLNINIPAGAKSHEHVNECAATCTQVLYVCVHMWCFVHVYVCVLCVCVCMWCSMYVCACCEMGH